ncbi:MAG: diacylglycerol kinase family lipid kinase [Muribaculaceae bacterium]|nr:diacylglycerol kinase family lipid kinase [Muribaculaceae bacterium]MDE7393851.1 diacylglycerol kinase family lipid kinase [Muribaculaceae bacterium]
MQHSPAKKAMLIINPISGNGKKEGLAEMVVERLSPKGYQIDVRKTAAHGDATSLAREAVAKGYDAVFAAGGDGTVNETARALCGSKTALGILPAGSGNGLARHIGLPVDINVALDVIGRDNVVDCDYATVNGREFFCTMGIGFDAAVSHAFAQKSRRGLITYLQSTFQQYLNYKPETYTISANGKVLTERAFVVACCNASQYGNNAYVAPEASIRDGLLDIVIIHQGSPIDTAMVGMDLFTGYINRNTLIHSFRTPSAVIYRSQPGPAHIDGEPMIIEDILDVKCCPGAIKLYVPDDKQAFKPVVTPLRSIWKAITLPFTSHKKQ